MHSGFKVSGLEFLVSGFLDVRGFGAQSRTQVKTTG